MKTNLNLGKQGMNEGIETFVQRSFRTLEEASNEDAMVIADSYTVSNFTDTRSLNAGTATLAQLAAFVATFISDLQKRSINRAE
jgi:hypothetical protein